MGREFRALPYPGGLIDQPRGAIERLEVVIEVVREFEEEEAERIRREQVNGDRRA